MGRRAPAGVLLGSLALLAACEGGARLLPLGLPDLADKHLAWAVGQQKAFVADGEKLRTAPQLEEQGNWKEEFAARKPAGTFRVICVGDSTTAGWPYNPAGAYPRWLRAILADARPDLKVEVVNAGFHGFDSRRALAVLRETLAFQPDAVVFRAGYNDVHLYRARLHPASPLAGWLTFHSQLYNLARRLRGRKPGGFSLQPRAPQLSGAERDGLVAAFEADVRAAASAARAARVPLVLGDLPDASSLHPYPGQDSVALLRASLAAFSAREGVPLARYPDLKAERFVDHVHCDAEGNRIVALGVAHALERAAPGRWRWDRVRSAGELARDTGVLDPEFSAHVHVRLAGMRLAKGDPEGAVEELEAALKAAPNPRMVPEEIEGSRNPQMLAALARAKERRTAAR